MENKDVNNVLNKIVASHGVFYVRLHQFHWFIKGSHFFTLHEKFEELYDDVTANMDLVAERLLALGGQPYATLNEFLEHSVLEERVEDRDLSQDKMVQAVITDLRSMGNLLDEGITLTDETKDFPSNDMLIVMKEEAEKQIWMLNAYLGNIATK